MEVLEGSHEFFKFKLCNYNILEISLKKIFLKENKTCEFIFNEQVSHWGNKGDWS